jgi:hypothetical protein
MRGYPIFRVPTGQGKARRRLAAACSVGEDGESGRVSGCLWRCGDGGERCSRGKQF